MLHKPHSRSPFAVTQLVEAKAAMYMKTAAIGSTKLAKSKLMVCASVLAEDLCGVWLDGYMEELLTPY